MGSRICRHFFRINALFFVSLFALSLVWLHIPHPPTFAFLPGTVRLGKAAQTNRPLIRLGRTKWLGWEVGAFGRVWEVEFFFFSWQDRCGKASSAVQGGLPVWFDPGSRKAAHSASRATGDTGGGKACSIVAAPDFALFFP